MTIFPSNIRAILPPHTEMNTGKSTHTHYEWLVFESYNTGGSPIYRRACLRGGYSTDNRKEPTP